MTVSKAADRSSKISNEDLPFLQVLGLQREQGSLGGVSTSEARLVAVQEVVLCEKDRVLDEHNALKAFNI